jgi:hypothetical protein
VKLGIWFWIQFFKEILIAVPILKIRPCFDLILTNPNWNQWLVHFQLSSSQSPFRASFLFKNFKNLISVSRANGTENLAQSLKFRKKRKKENQVLIPILIPKFGSIYGSVLTNQNWNQQFLPPKVDTCFTHTESKLDTNYIYVYDLDP